MITSELLRSYFDELVRSGLVHILFWLMILDICSGYAKAFKTKRFDSKVGVNGLIRHVLVFSVMIIIGVYARAFEYPGISKAACGFFILNYLLSLTENWEALGLPFPQSLKPFFHQMRLQSERQLRESLHIDKLEVEEIEIDKKGEDKHDVR